MVQSEQLNLARRWRSRTFQEIIGQELVIRLLKNSLYKGQFFPVYLLAGQRGSGKTTTGRVFAAAVNCVGLEDFKKNPQAKNLPCLTCSSCVAMQQAHHPDFIEIDAASHTGVDNVRQIIEAASFLPIMGRKKIYLIDEAHMLSKAAFNALLKILEEPPHSALFLLATTESHKIIDTVKSRCFQLFFDPVSEIPLREHLIEICTKEEISYDIAGLDLIIQESEGSVRDALNVIERIRFSDGEISYDSVARVLGHVSDRQLIQLFDFMSLDDTLENIIKGATGLLAGATSISHKAPPYVIVKTWQRIVSLIRALLYKKNSVILKSWEHHEKEIQELSKKFSAEQLIIILEFLYESEQLLTKTTIQTGFLEFIVGKIVLLIKKPVTTEPVGKIELRTVKSPASTSVPQKAEAKPVPVQVTQVAASREEVKLTVWEQFLKELSQLQDPLLESVFSKGHYNDVDEQGTLILAFPREFVFFQDLLENNKIIWQPLLNKIFGRSITLTTVFNLDRTKVRIPVPVPQQQERKEVIHAPSPTPPMIARNFVQKKTEKLVDVADVEKWPKTNALLRLFPGTVTELGE